MPFSVGNRVSCSAIKVLGEKPAKQRFGRLSATKELDGVVEEVQARDWEKSEDGEEVGQTEVFNKTVKRKKIVESYFDAASIIDINNQMRQGGWHWKQHGEPSLGQTVLWQQFLRLWKLMHTSCTRSSTQEAVC